jgi:outer membrane protein with beta-barrel domain
MRRMLVASLALVAVINAPAAAQTCLGLASFSHGNMQVSGNGQFNDGSNRFGAGFNYGLPASVFAGAQISTTSFDGADASSLGIGANVGYQMTVGKAANIHVCPVASLELGMGPDDDAAGIDASSRNANIGFSLGTTMGSTPRMQIVPTAGLGLAYTKLSLDDGAATTDVSETYGQARLGVGFIFNQQIAVRPSIDIPLGLDNSDPTFGVTVAYSFGSKPAPARKR